MSNFIMDFLFPPVCPHCGAAVFREGNWCEPCLDDVWNIHEVTDHNSRFLDRVLVLGTYTGGLKTILHDVKFNGKKERSQGIAPFLYRLNTLPIWEDIDIVIPVPVSSKSLKNRGWNQVELFFKDWVIQQQHTWGGWQWQDILLKLETQESMWHLSRTEREKNMKGAFLPKQICMEERTLENKRVLIIDDIYTTGATLREVARVVHSLGAIKIEALTIASGAS